MPPASTIRFLSRDRRLVEIPSDAARYCTAIQNLIEKGEGKPIRVRQVEKHTLLKIIAWCEYHSESHPKWNVRAWDEYEFARNLRGDEILHVLDAAQVLGIPELVELCCYCARIDNEAIESLWTFPPGIQSKILSYMTPYKQLKAAAEGSVTLTKAQEIHATIWTRIIKDDRWFQEAIYKGTNPFLVGPLFDNPSYLVLISAPTYDSGDILQCLHPSREQNHSSDDESSNSSEEEQGYDSWKEQYSEDVILRNTSMTINIWQPHHSEKGTSSRNVPVYNLEKNLVRTLNGKRTTAILELRDPELHYITLQDTDIRVGSPYPDEQFRYGRTFDGWTLVDESILRRNTRLLHHFKKRNRGTVSPTNLARASSTSSSAAVMPWDGH